MTKTHRSVPGTQGTVLIAWGDDGWFQRWVHGPVMMTGVKPNTHPLEVVMMARSMSVSEREEIMCCLVEDRDMSWTGIGRRLGRCRTTIRREVERNGGRGSYRPSAAEERAERLRCRPRPLKLAADTELRALVVDDLDAGFSPAAIRVRVRSHGHRVATETIYQAVYSGVLGRSAKECLRTRRPKRRSRLRPDHHKGDYLGECTPISERPAHVECRIEPGHWEGDLIIGANNQSAMVSLIERVSRLTHLISLPDGYGTEPVVAQLDAWLQGLDPTMCRTLTWDRGAELTQWAQLAVHIDVFFCDPRSPWQRGSCEQNNRTLRFWLPKGTHLNNVDIEPILNIINNQPRRTLNWQTPNQIYNQHLTGH